MELTLKNLLNARITKLRTEAEIRAKAERLLRTVYRFAGLLRKIPAIHWEPTCAFEVSEHVGGADLVTHEFVIFKMNEEEGGTWCLCLHEKRARGAVFMGFYLFPSSPGIHFHGFRAFIKSALHAPGQLSTAELELLSPPPVAKKLCWAIRSLHYRNPENELIPQIFFSALTELEHHPQ